MTRWTHLHTFVAGMAAAWLASRDAVFFFALLVLVFALGYFVREIVRSVRIGWKAAGRAVERMEEAHRAKVAVERARASELRTRTKDRARRVGEQRELERKAYVRGAIDQADRS